MFKSIRQKQLNATTAIAILALVFGMTGGAWAAKKYLITSTKQISPSVLKALKGAAGKNGANGTSGAAGPAGPTGPGGAQGGSGSEGKQGGEGKEGKEGPPGKEGKPGKEGSPWTINSQLPEKATETGAWSFGPVGEGTPLVPIASFVVKLKAPLDTLHVHFINANGKEEKVPGTEIPAPAACPGKAAEPAATSGNLCVYAASLSRALTGSIAIAPPDGGEGAGVAGALQLFITEAGGEGRGTWAVTG